ncbi:hypothetical protein ACU4GR_03975 [Methylobacterium oryzae CBMB20]|uniref:hypothetical protein n=1 Tax=Methylobacterium oryzae TaxID=334852 RepID=UPI002F353755
MGNGPIASSAGRRQVLTCLPFRMLRLTRFGLAWSARTDLLCRSGDEASERAGPGCAKPKPWQLGRTCRRQQ